MMWYNGARMIGFGWGWLIAIAIFVLVILGILALSRYLRQPGQKEKPPISHSAIGILNERYAKGEISDEEYRAKKTELLK